MAQRQKTFKKYEQSRKNTEKILKSINRHSKKALKKRHKQVRRHKHSYRYTAKTNNSCKSSKHSQKEPSTFGDELVALVLIAIVILAIVLLFTCGVRKTVIILAVVLGALFIIAVIREITVEKKTSGFDAESEQGKIDYLHTLLEELETSRDIVNSSDNPDEVKTRLDTLLIVMDEIMTYDEELLRKAGMTKETMPEQKARVLELYDTIIEQAYNSTSSDGENHYTE